MPTVKFLEVTASDTNEYVFVDKQGNRYYMYSDARGSEIKGVNRDFWDKFYFSDKINIDYSSKDNKNFISKVNSLS